MTPITAAPPGREETTTSLSLHPHANAGNTSQFHTPALLHGESPFSQVDEQKFGIWIPLFALGNLQVEMNCWHDLRS